MLRDELTNLLEPVIESVGYELVLLEFIPQARSALLRLYIDKEKGITLEDCETVSREVAALLDVEDPIRQPYRLEVSSPGMDRPLTKPAHFSRFVGELVKLQLFAPRSGRKRFSGRIVNVTESALQLDTEMGVLDFEFAAIERARLVPDYDKG